MSAAPEDFVATPARRVRYTLPERFLDGAAVTMFILMGVCTLAQVLFRYFLHLPAPWTEEAARTLFVLSMLMGIAFAYREGEHIVVDFLFLKLPERARRVVLIGFDIAILMFLAMWARGALQLAQLNWGSRLVTIEFFRVSYFYIWEIGAIALTALYVTLHMAALIRGERRGPADTPHVADS